MRLSSLTDIGVKRKDNQDNYWSARLEVDGELCGVVCLCDGMGGLDDGAFASRSVVEAVREYFRSSIDFKGLVDVIKGVNDTLYSRSKELGVSLGTTCTVLMCYRGSYYVLHIGDSRCYRACSLEGVVSILTSDHTVLEKYRSAGRELPPKLVRKYRNTLTRCVGVSPSIDLDYYSGEYAEGDLFIVCSDGFWHYLEDSSFFNGDFEDLEGLVRKYISMGETDNITVGVLEC